MNILIVDDHELFRNGLCLLLEKQIKGVFVYHADSCQVAVNILNRKGIEFDYIFLDMGLPDTEGYSGVIEIQNAAPDALIVIVSGYDQYELTDPLPGLPSVRGFIKKTTSNSEIEIALKQIMESDKYFYSCSSNPSDRALDLTGKQLQILSLVCRGFSNQKISIHLGIAENTVKNHVATILKILSADNRNEACFIARKLRII